MRVLIVDDHEPVRRGIRSLLARRLDWSVCGEAADGLEATEMARQLRPDVVLMDMSMPRMDGAEATRIIRRQVPEAEVIIVSQNDPAVVRLQAAQIGARGYVSKATLARDLLPAILKIIGKDNNGDESGENSNREPTQEKWLFGGGDLGHLIRQHTWSLTPLGPIHNWPQSLKTAVNLMLNSQHPMWIGWGPEMTFLYNDAHISVLSLAKHPGSLGRPAREVWAEIWDICGPLADKVFSRGEPSFANDVRLFMSRGEYVEETYYSFSYSPIHDESGKVAGLVLPEHGNDSESLARTPAANPLGTLRQSADRKIHRKSMLFLYRDHFPEYRRRAVRFALSARRGPRSGEARRGQPGIEGHRAREPGGNSVGRRGTLGALADSGGARRVSVPNRSAAVRGFDSGKPRWSFGSRSDRSSSYFAGAEPVGGRFDRRREPDAKGGHRISNLFLADGRSGGNGDPKRQSGGAGEKARGCAH